MSAADFPADWARFDAWAERHVPDYRGPSVATKFATGQSNPTYRIDSPSGALVVRRKPTGKLLKSAHMIEREYRVLKALERFDYPAPQALALCEDAGVIGSNFYVMRHVEGRIFWDPALPELGRDERAAIYDAMNAGLARLHAINIARAGLEDFGKPGNYFARQMLRWSEQYRASQTQASPDMDRLTSWLGANTPADDGRVALVHGDWRIDNMIFAPTSSELIGVLDWELSTLGHPYSDLAYQCMQWRLPNAGEFRGLGGVDRLALGIPSEADYVASYCRRAGVAAIENWRFLIAFSFFRIAAIVQGVYKRALDGNASNPARARRMGEAVPLMARLALESLER